MRLTSKFAFSFWFQFAVSQHNISAWETECVVCLIQSADNRMSQFLTRKIILEFLKFSSEYQKQLCFIDKKKKPDYAVENCYWKFFSRSKWLSSLLSYARFWIKHTEIEPGKIKENNVWWTWTLTEKRIDSNLWSFEIFQLTTANLVRNL